jgi:hypothetical protein
MRELMIVVKPIRFLVDVGALNTLFLSFAKLGIWRGV